jgi:hypothetical protein
MFEITRAKVWVDRTRNAKSFGRGFLKPIGIENKDIKQRNVPININMKLFTILFRLFFFSCRFQIFNERSLQ